jgi:predicted amidohydrolase
MPRKVKIVTSSFATFENTHPPFNIHPPKPEENIALAKKIIETATSYQPDIIVLPETFKFAGMPSEMANEIAEPVPGPTFHMLSDLAKKGKTHIIAGHMVKENGKIYNKALIINRQGDLAGSYIKKYPVEGEILNGIMPGTTTPVFDLDFARVGVSVCFDLNWPGLWQDFADQQIEMAFWVSAYEGGFPLQVYAWQFRYPIVTSVQPYHARVIDLDGRILCSTSRWSRIAFCEMNLDRAVFHTDLQMEKIQKIQQKYGSAIKVRTYTEEHLFILENEVDGKTIQDIIQEFDLVTYSDYIARCTDFRANHLKANS